VQYLRILGRGRLGGAIVASLIACFCFVSTAEAGKRHHGRHGHARAVARGGGSDDGIAASDRYAAYVVDDKTGRVLFSKNADAPRHPASLTKMMTLYILFEELSKKRMALDTPLKVSVHAASQAPSKLGVRPGETIAVEDAIRALVTKSANDVAVTIAENIGGSEAAFAKRMTQTARRIGMNGTTFYNASGLPNAAQWTTAHDMVTLGRALAERHPTYYRYFSTRSFAWNRGVIGNHNKLLYRMEGIDGIKTGYTQASGFNLVSSLRRDGRHVVAAVMGGSSGRERDDHMVKLLSAHIGSASTGGKVSSVFREHGRTADASDDDDAIQTIAALEQAAPTNSITGAMPAPAPTPAVAPAPAPAKAAVEPLALTSSEAPSASPATMAPPAPAATPARAAAKAPNQPRIAASDVVPLGRRDEAPRAADQHGAAVAMARAILLPQTGRPAHVEAPAPVAVKTVAVTPRLEEKSDKPPSLATATVTQAEVDEIVTGTVARRATEEKAATTAKPTVAAVAPVVTTRTGWLVQIGAFDQEKKARDALTEAKSKAGSALARAEGFTESVGGASSGLWRARFAGFADQDAADGACKALKRKSVSCLALRQ
jgi:D-alanyl-D-alanine carboxypeptidase